MAAHYLRAGRRYVNKWSAHDRATVALSVICLTRGIRYIFFEPDTDFFLDTTGIPLWLFGALWICASIWGFADAIRRRQGRMSMALAACLLGFWAFWYALSAMAGGGADLWVTTAFLAAASGVAWEHPKQIAMSDMENP